MTAKKSNQSVGIIATIFTSVVAPTLVALFTTAIKDAPAPPDPPANSQAKVVTTGTASPPVTLLPPTPAERQALVVRSAYRWQPAATSQPPTALAGSVRQY
jgi:hypothetical protein